MPWIRTSVLPLAAALLLGAAPGLRAAVATICVNVENPGDAAWDLQREKLAGDTGTIQLVDNATAQVIPNALTSDAPFTVAAKTTSGGVLKVVSVQIQYIVPLKSIGTTSPSFRLFSLKDRGGRIMQFRISYPANLETNTTNSVAPEKIAPGNQMPFPKAAVFSVNPMTANMATIKILKGSLE